MRKSPMVVLMSAVGLLLTQSANSAPPTSPIIGEAATASPAPLGGTNVPGGNKILYVGPTPDLTAVANAIQVQAKSLTSLVTVGSRSRAGSSSDDQYRVPFGLAYGQRSGHSNLRFHLR